MTNQPHRPSSMCVDTCDNPYVCADEYQVAELQVENERLRAALLGITQCLGEGACKQLNCPGCQHEMREAADLARAALAPREER